VATCDDTAGTARRVAVNGEEQDRSV